MNSLEIPKIYFCTVQVEYKYKKSKLSKEVDVVSYYKTPYQIMDDEMTRRRIERAVYPSTYKSEKSFIVRKVLSAKQIGVMSKQSYLNQLK